MALQSNKHEKTKISQYLRVNDLNTVQIKIILKNTKTKNDFSPKRKLLD